MDDAGAGRLALALASSVSVGLFGRQTDRHWTGRTGGSAHSRDGWPAAAATSKQQQLSSGSEGSAHYSHDRAQRPQTAQPEDLGRDAGGGGAGVRGWWMDDGVQHKPTWVRRLPPIRVGWCGGSRDVCLYTGTLLAC